jgi:mono/diheme cytochrome c family protein
MAKDSRMRHAWLLAIAACSLGSPLALAQDIDRGRDIALQQCAACHIVTRVQRNEVADAPPFEMIGRKRGFEAAALAYAILDPHPKMNFIPTQQEAADVAAYISGLSK